MARLPNSPNKKCINCQYWEGPKNRIKGMVFLDRCLKGKGESLPHHYLCKEHVYFMEIKASTTSLIKES